MKKKIIGLLLSIMFIPGVIYAESINGTGYGTTLNEARQEALSELVQTIRVEVSSEFKSITKQKNGTVDEFKTKAIQLKSELPVLGVVYKERSSKKGFVVNAVLPFSVVNLYELELKKITDLIKKDFKNYKLAGTNVKKSEFLKTILTNIDQYYKYRIVAQLLKSSKIPEIDITESKIKGMLSELEKKADTINFGARVLASEIHRKNIYIYPPVPQNSSEVTQFGSAVKDHLSVYLKTALSPEKASYFLTGEYRILKKGIELTCHVIDKKNNTLKTAMSFFLPSAYAGYDIEPAALDFEKLINKGIVVSKDFKANIKTEKGKRDLLYKKGDTMHLLVKLNKPGYFYLVSHNLKAKKYSYIVNYTEVQGDRKFIYYVNGDFVNKWIELGEFEIVPPFGVETLQMIASTEDLIDKIPENFFDPATGLYKIGSKKTGMLSRASNPKKALATTRGLMIKKKSGHTEAFLVFTSMKKN